jgi:hypothetical protein
MNEAMRQADEWLNDFSGVLNLEWPEQAEVIDPSPRTVHEDLHVLRRGLQLSVRNAKTHPFRSEIRTAESEGALRHTDGAEEMRTRLDTRRPRRHVIQPSANPHGSRQSNHRHHEPSTLHMTERTQLHILQYNVWKSRDIVLAGLFNDARILEYDVIAIQEPWRNPFKNTTYHPLKTQFSLTYLDDPATRVCFYVSSRIDPGTWTVTYISRDIIRLNLCDLGSGRRISIYNVYNEIGTDTLSVLAQAVTSQDPHEKIVLVDFNLHHPCGQQGMLEHEARQQPTSS